jgi:hypothetical protein
MGLLLLPPAQQLINRGKNLCRGMIHVFSRALNGRLLLLSKLAQDRYPAVCNCLRRLVFGFIHLGTTPEVLGDRQTEEMPSSL